MASSNYWPIIGASLVLSVGVSRLTEYGVRDVTARHRKGPPSSGGAREHPDEGAAFPDGGAETPRAAAAPPSGVWGGSGFIAFGQLRIASPATICRICNG